MAPGFSPGAFIHETIDYSSSALLFICPGE
jgi:hypothetical protein